MLLRNLKNVESLSSRAVLSLHLV
eukprot:SAG25_NODE_12070_length_288_cov_1.317460_1_plen_23_part_01